MIAIVNKYPLVTLTVMSLWRSLRRDLFSKYRPELHYMRGRGPKSRAKHQNPCRAPVNKTSIDNGRPL